MEVTYSEDMKHAFFDGETFGLDAHGYFCRSSTNKKLHRCVYEYHFGKIEDGYHIHHKDFNKFNNNIYNLEKLSHSEHISLHAKKRCLDKEWFDKFQSLGTESAKEWSKTDEGRKWYKQHYDNTKHLLNRKYMSVCKLCGKEYEAVNNGNSKFCSIKCRAKYRRDSGVDDVERMCEICGETFTTTKYKKTKTCSDKCRCYLRSLEYKNKKSTIIISV